MNIYQQGRIFMGRLEKDEDLYQQITKIVRENEIETGIVKVIGAVQKANIGYYRQDEKEYIYQQFNQPLEIVSCIGNVSLLEENPMVHAHIALAAKDGTTYGGHLGEGTIVFAAEVYIQEVKGDKLRRKFDSETELTLW
ncbi:MAG: PPC domain-containing DNA-binding protein [Halanaerobiaceae bacterium]